jgi:hypothetical protein
MAVAVALPTTPVSTIMVQQVLPVAEGELTVSGEPELLVRGILAAMVADLLEVVPEAGEEPVQLVRMGAERLAVMEGLVSATISQAVRSHTAEVGLAEVTGRAVVERLARPIQAMVAKARTDQIAEERSTVALGVPGL